MRHPFHTAGLAGVVLAAAMLAAASAQADLAWSGAIRNDVYVWQQENRTLVFNLLENQLILQRSAAQWRFYGDVRIDLYRGEFSRLFPEEAPDQPAELALVRVLRAFVRYFSEAGDITVGKTYVNFGVASLFNPFELDRAYNVTDFSYTREGVFAVTDEIALGDLAGLKLYLGPTDDNTQIAGGADAQFHVGTFDFGVVGQRLGRNNTVVGAYARGDLEVGVQAAVAWHLDDQGVGRDPEANLGVDYSFGEGKWIVSLLGYYNGGAAGDAGARVPLSQATAFGSRAYVYAEMLWLPDEFFQVRVSGLMNASDASSLLIPSATWVLADGLSLNLQALIPTGAGDTQYSRPALGNVIGLARVEAKL